MFLPIGLPTKHDFELIFIIKSSLEQKVTIAKKIAFLRSRLLILRSPIAPRSFDQIAIADRDPIAKNMMVDRDCWSKDRRWFEYYLVILGFKRLAKSTKVSKRCHRSKFFGQWQRRSIWFSSFRQKRFSFCGRKCFLFRGRRRKILRSFQTPETEIGD